MCESGTVKPTRNCHQCGAAFVSKQPKKHRFCCKPCADKWSAANAIQKRHAICQHCGEGYHPKASNRLSFCSRQCARTARSSKQIAERKAGAEANRLRLLFERLRQCCVCSAAFVARSGRQKSCSEGCRRIQSVVNGLVASGYSPASKPCLICGTDVGPYVPGTRRSHYCQQCQAEGRKAAKRRARLKREGKLSVLSKDRLQTKRTIKQVCELIAQFNGTCPSCGLTMSRHAPTNTDRRLELDHALPLSKGGMDEWPNIRPLCRKCNGFKSDFVAPDIIISTWMDSGVRS